MRKVKLDCSCFSVLLFSSCAVRQQLYLLGSSCHQATAAGIKEEWEEIQKKLSFTFFTCYCCLMVVWCMVSL